jgi:Tetracyclin repressor-like, C-terminal domain
MSVYSPEFTVTDLAGLAPRWDKLIAADLVIEVENDTADRVETIDEMRLLLAIKGYRQIFDLLTGETAGKTGAAALRAMAVASRGYAKERPGLSAATFRCPMIESPEWMAAFTAVRRLFEKAFAECGLEEVAAAHALRILRSLVRGFVINEMSGSAAASAEFDESFDFAMDIFLGGLPALRINQPCARNIAVSTLPTRTRSMDPQPALSVEERQ